MESYDYSKVLEEYGDDPRSAYGNKAMGRMTSRGNSAKTERAVQQPTKAAKQPVENFYTKVMDGFDEDPRVAAGANATMQMQMRF